MLDGIVERLAKMSSITRTWLGAFAASITFYVGAYVGHTVGEAAEEASVPALVAQAVVYIALLAIVVALARLIAARIDQVRDREKERIAFRLHAYAQLDRVEAAEVKRAATWHFQAEDFIEQFVASVRGLTEVVEACYNAFESSYGTAATTEERVDFEVTFMTRSFRDGAITIPAHANRDGRAPASMLLRETDPTIYDRSVTAQIYREPRPTIKIVESTADSASGYQELYPAQKHRIRSSIVFPVLSDANSMLGCLVVHCDRDRFFAHRDEKFWTDVLEVFAKRIAVIKIRMDLLDNYWSSSETLILSAQSRPF